MLKIDKGEPWLFWPSSICETFPEKPANLILSGEYNFELELSFILKDESQEQKSIFTIVPHYTGLDLYNDQTVFTVTFEDKARYYRLPRTISPHKVTNIRIEHKVKEHFKIFIDKEEVVSESLVDKVLGKCPHPHIIFGAGNFPKNNFNLNYTDINLLRFSLFQNDSLLADHFFEERIFDKYVDVTGNLNFIHKV